MTYLCKYQYLIIIIVLYGIVNIHIHFGCDIFGVGTDVFVCCNKVNTAIIIYFQFTNVFPLKNR